VGNLASRNIFNLKKAYPDKAPKSFGNVQAWKAFVLAYATDPDLLYRLSH
jgi:hypothetical protein